MATIVVVTVNHSGAALMGRYHYGPFKTEGSLKAFLDKVDKIEDDHIVAVDVHELNYAIDFNTGRECG